jgi:hypothetical protein
MQIGSANKFDYSRQQITSKAYATYHSPMEKPRFTCRTMLAWVTHAHARLTTKMMATR